MKFICPIKINLNLHLISKRNDGYHNLQSLVVFVGRGDTLSFYPEGEMSLREGAPKPKETERLQVTGPFAGAVPTDGTNTILRAHRAFEAALGHPVAGRWQLNKTVPVGAGLGSASANAAGALRVLQKMHPLREDEVLSIGKSIGSDVPICLLSQNAIMEGTGDRLTLTPDVITPPLVIVFPDIALSTKIMFDSFSSEKSNFCNEMSIKNMKNIFATHNAFESLACQKAPVIAKVLESLRNTTGCRLARLSGSGSACFGIYETEDQAADASHVLKIQYPDMCVWP